MKNQIQNASEVKNSSRTSTLAHETRKDRQMLTMFVTAVANHGGAMEADNILTHKANSKSQMISINYLLVLVLLAAVMFSMLACGNGGMAKDIEKLVELQFKCLDQMYPVENGRRIVGGRHERKKNSVSCNEFTILSDKLYKKYSDNIVNFEKSYYSEFVRVSNKIFNERGRSYTWDDIN